MTIFIDLECFFNRKGKPRTFTRFFQAAIVTESYSRNFWVNPLPEFDIQTPNDLVDALYKSGARPNPSILFWSKTLLNANHKLYKKLFKTAAYKKYKPMHRIEDETVIHCHVLAKFINMCPYTEEIFITTMKRLAIHKQCPVVAHNGKAFDFRVIKGAAARRLIDIADVQFIDSLPVFKRKWPKLKSYAQTKLYAHVFPNKTYMAHDALHDAIALQQLWESLPNDVTCAPKKNSIRPPTSPITPLRKPNTHGAPKQIKTESKKCLSSLSVIPGIGPKTIEKLHKQGINNIDQLRAIYEKKNTLRGTVHHYNMANAYFKSTSSKARVRPTPPKEV